MKRKNSKTKFSIIYNPYKIYENDTLADLYDRYFEDNDRVHNINGVKFYKAIQIIKTDFRMHKLVVALSYEMNLKVNSLLVDNHDNTFIVKAFVMVRLNCPELPDWYKKMGFVCLAGESYDNIGTHFAVIKDG